MQSRSIFDEATDLTARSYYEVTLLFVFLIKYILSYKYNTILSIILELILDH